MTNQTKKRTEEKNLLYILTGTVINIGILFLPNSVGTYAKQDGWISVLIASIHPLYIIYCSIYLKNHHDTENILMLSRRYLGNFLGSFCNLIFMLKFFIFLSSSSAGIFSFIKTYTSIPISNFIFIFMFLIVGAYSATLGFKALTKMSAFIFYVLIIILLIGVNIFEYGSFQNILPLMSEGLNPILKGSLNSLYSYSGMEVLLLIYTNFDDKKKFKKYSLLSVVAVVFIYTSITLFINIYWESSLVQRALWSTIYIVESIRNPIINNLRFILLYFWIILTLKSSGLYYYFINSILMNTFNKVKLKDFYLIIYIAAAVVALTFKNEVMRREISTKIMNGLFLFDLIFISIIVMFTFIKKDEVYEK